MKRRKIRIIAGILICAVLMWLLLENVSAIVRPKDDGYYKTTFMENADDIDVLFLGTSHMINAVFPMELWNDYGIASYNMAGHANTIPDSYWVMMNALDYSDPELIVLDCLGISDETKTTENHLHGSMDNFALSRTKISAINDLFTDPLKKQEYLFDFSLYHNRWSELSKIDFEGGQSVQYGGEIRAAVAVPGEMSDVNGVEKQAIDTYGTDYLRKIIEECRERGIDLLLTYLPFPAQEKEVNESLVVEDIADEYGVEYLNFLRMDIVDYDTDCYDENSHLNPSGAGKVTQYIGNYIQSNYGFEDNRENEAYRDWNENYKTYISDKADMIKEESDLAAYLMLLRSRDISICLYIKGGSDIFKDERIYRLIENIPTDQQTEKLNRAAEERKDYFLMVDNGRIWEHIQNENGLDMNMSFGSVCYSNDREGKTLEIKNTEGDYLYKSCDNNMFDAEIQIFVIDKEKNEIIDAVTHMQDGSYALIRTEIE